MNIKKFYDAYEQLTRQIESRWEELAGFGCGYFIDWSVSGDDIIIRREISTKYGGGLGDNHRIPIECFQVTLEEAKRILHAKKHL